MPFTVLFCLARFLIHQLGWRGWDFDGLASALVAATTFVTAFVLSGILTDYKLSEGLPADLCSSVEAIQDCNSLEASSHAEYDPQPLLGNLIQLLEELHNWLLSGQSPELVLQRIAGLSPWFAQMEAFSAPPLISRLQLEQAKLRQMVLRIQVIRETNFVPPAYAILELFTAATIGALLFLNGEQPLRETIQSAVLFTAFIYMQLLIRDLDNPFEYQSSSSADVSLAIVLSAIQRLKQTTDITATLTNATH
ncbi:hypothetical protein [Neosynechococcus sphagnicola]|uniref:hypothetical protein n=1 Tax=Neosynechococcus sphagnicola TaxID=1501145 RepID=UPI0019554025|nr:hypothetical protein [Neosynechococcus sphagnicola]